MQYNIDRMRTTYSHQVFPVMCLQVWQEVLWQLQKLLSPEEAGRALDSNLQHFHSAQAIIKILLTSKVITNSLLAHGLIIHCLTPGYIQSRQLERNRLS